MTSSSVLAAAAALGEFTIAEIATYCAADCDDIVAVLTAATGAVEEVGTSHGEQDADSRRWLVVDPRHLRRLIAEAPRSVVPTPVTGVYPRSDDDLVRIRLLRAEETLSGCADEQSTTERQLMAGTAMNYLRQYVAARVAQRNWWDIEFDGEQLEAGLASRDAANASRVRVDFALARMTSSEALGQRVSRDYLMRTAREVCQLTGSKGVPRLRDLVALFIELAGELARPAGECAMATAPLRLLAALGWRRVRAQVEPDVERASQDVVSLLRWMEHGPQMTDGGSLQLYRFRGHLPDGRNRITVYSDLLATVPRQYGWQCEDELVPGVLVGALVDSPAASHLELCANTLEADLVQAPFGSDSALIGMAVHVLQDLAARVAEVDRDVLPRSDETRRQLLSLADVRAGSA